MRIMPAANSDFLLLRMTIPLIDTTLQMNLYKVYLAPLHPDLKLHFIYVLEGQYLAVAKHGMYTALPTEHNIHI